MAIELTEAAAERVGTFLHAQPDAIGLRLGVRKSGCSGYAYVVDLTSQVGAGDRVFESRGFKVVVDQDHLAMVDGTEIDFVRQSMGAQFVFRNPNVSGGCGCGESFTTV